MVNVTDINNKELPIMDEKVFKKPIDNSNNNSGGGYAIRLDRDSYIWCFTGRRGGGKTTAMTFFIIRTVALYNMRVVSNYPIEFMLRRHKPDGKSYLQHVRSEPLDFEKLICMDEDYRHVLICIDEAPDIISHMASLSWRNRLLAAFTRQIRKNYNSLFLAAQDFNLIDKSMRWQVDVITECRDLARVAGDDSKLEAGEAIILKFQDHSGQWTGYTSEDRIRRKKNPCVGRVIMYPRLMWGDDSHQAVYDSWHQIDLMDSLRRVELKLNTIKIGDNVDEGEYIRYPVSSEKLWAALGTIKRILSGQSDNPSVYQPSFYASLGTIGERDKNNLGKLLSQYNVIRTRDTQERIYRFDEFNIVDFEKYIEAHAGGGLDKVYGGC